MNEHVAYTGGCVHIPNGRLSMGGEQVSIETGGKVYYFSWHHYHGPTAERKDGRGDLAKQPSERSPFWDAVHWWHKQGMRVDDNGRAIFQHETALVHILRKVGKRAFMVLG